MCSFLHKNRLYGFAAILCHSHIKICSSVFACVSTHATTNSDGDAHDRPGIVSLRSLRPRSSAPSSSALPCHASCDRVGSGHYRLKTGSIRRATWLLSLAAFSYPVLDGTGSGPPGYGVASSMVCERIKPNCDEFCFCIVARWLASERGEITIPRLSEKTIWKKERRRNLDSAVPRI